MTAPAALVEQVAAYFGQSLPSRIGVAVSGGSDSLALLHILHSWGAVPVDVVTVDHGLRPEAAAEAAYVGDLCATLRCHHDVLRWEDWDGRGNLQDQARRARYAAIAGWARARGLETVALGHTLDDQAETLLMRLARGSGVDGLAAMRARFERYGMRFDRPLLGVRREELRAFLDERSIRWVEDPSNDDGGFERVRARRVLAELAPLGIDAPGLAEIARNLRDASAALAAVASRAAGDLATVDRGDLVFDRTALRQHPREITRRLIAGALRWVSSSEYPPRRAPLDDLLAAIAAGGNRTLHGCRILISGMTVRVTRELDGVTALATATNELWDGRWRLEGPHDPALEIRALGEALKDCPDWRSTAMPRVSLLASPAVWRGETLVAAPVAGLDGGWTAHVEGLQSFAASLIAH